MNSRQEAAKSHLNAAPTCDNRKRLRRQRQLPRSVATPIARCNMTDRTCSEPGCNRKHDARGLCNMHWQSAKRAGTLPPRITPEERFVAKYRILDNGCWEWTATINQDGYGLFSLNRRMTGAHRAAYILFVGPIPEGLEIDHVCHTRDDLCIGGPWCVHRQCVNPAHLEAVTGRENDRRAKANQMCRTAARRRADEAKKAAKLRRAQGESSDE